MIVLIVGSVKAVNAWVHRSFGHVFDWSVGKEFQNKKIKTFLCKTLLKSHVYQVYSELTDPKFLFNNGQFKKTPTKFSPQG